MPELARNQMSSKGILTPGAREFGRKEQILVKTDVRESIAPTDSGCPSCDPN